MGKSIAFHGEFTWDIIAAAPFAYWLHERGELDETVGPEGSGPIYYFSPNHSAQGGRCGGAASFNALEKHEYRNIGGEVYEKELPDRRWKMPPYKEHFQNDRFRWDKPLLIISNKYTEEWGKPPVNYISVEVLWRLCNIFKDKYTILYIRPTYKERGIVWDNHQLFEWFDYEVIRKHFPEVIVFNDLLEQNPDVDYNTLQFMTHANCERFVSVIGGNATLCSVFGGTNIAYSISDTEHTKCYRKDGYYNTRLGTKLVFVTNHELEIVDRAVELWR